MCALGREKGEFFRADEMRGLRGEGQGDYEVVEAEGEEGMDGSFVEAVVPGYWNRAVCVAGAGDDVACIASRCGGWTWGSCVGVDGHSQCGGDSRDC